MTDAMTYLTVAGFGLVALTIAVAAMLKGWQGWLEVKRLELAGHRHSDARSPALDRIELADLKERVRQLESIAACVDL
jgi:hypothetical protein